VALAAHLYELAERHQCEDLGVGIEGNLGERGDVDHLAGE
jgi:hypothetical protein